MGVGMEKLQMNDATAGINISDHLEETTSGESKTKLTSSVGTEFWFSLPIGPIELSFGYGSSGVTTGCSTCGTLQTSEAVTKTTTQIGAEMIMSL